MLNILMVAEKPSVAERISEILSNNTCRPKPLAWKHASPVIEYQASFRGQPAKFHVTSTCGHVMNVGFPSECEWNRWGREHWKNMYDPIGLFDCEIEPREAKPEKKMLDLLKMVAEGCDILILWLDCDQAGEHICYEVIDAVEGLIKKPKDGQFMDVVFRAQFSSLTEQDIRRAMAELGKPNRHVWLAVEARQELDLRVGSAITRFLTDHFKKKYNQKLLTYGPCQTPALGFCVERHDEIVNFEPEEYCRIQASVQLPGGQQLELEWDRGKEFDTAKAQAVYEKIMNCKEARVVDIRMEEHTKQRPTALNTFELLRKASSRFGLSPSAAMEAAQSLYIKGCASYPRTETTAYPESFEFEPVLRELAKFVPALNQILLNGIFTPQPGVNKGDHPPITPQKVMTERQKRENAHHARLFEFMVKHFAATLMPPCKYSITTVKVLIGPDEGEQELFLAHSRPTVLEPGFTQLLPNEMAVCGTGRQQPAELLDSLRSGQLLAINNGVTLFEGMTSPPEYLTEAELVTLMEKHGIGTDGSISRHIEKINTCKYVEVNKDTRRLKPTDLGITLIHGYRAIDPDLVGPKMRADTEQQLDLVAQGKADYQTVKSAELVKLKQKYDNFVLNIGKVDSLFDELSKKNPAALMELGGRNRNHFRPFKCIQYSYSYHGNSATHGQEGEKGAGIKRIHSPDKQEEQQQKKKPPPVASPPLMGMGVQSLSPSSGIQSEPSESAAKEARRLHFAAVNWDSQTATCSNAFGQTTVAEPGSSNSTMFSSSTADVQPTNQEANRQTKKLIPSIKKPIP